MIVWGYVVMISRRWLSLFLVLLLLLPAAALATSPDVVRNATTGSAYTSLADAVSKAAAGDTLELLADVSLSAPLTINESLTLNFGAYTVRPDSSFDRPILVTVTAPVTLKGKTGGIDITGTKAKYCLDARSSLTIESGRYLSNAAVIQAVGAPVTVTGASFAAAARRPTTPSLPSTPLPLPPVAPMSKASSLSDRTPAFTAAPMPASCSPVPI